MVEGSTTNVALATSVALVAFTWSELALTEGTTKAQEKFPGLAEVLFPVRQVPTWVELNVMLTFVSFAKPYPETVTEVPTNPWVGVRLMFALPVNG